jgi:predicted negative regulator of RcsB-dependent stress response
VAVASAQLPADQIAQGDSLLRSLHPDQALAHYHAALRADSASYAALWKTARATIDIAKQITADDGPERKRRDSLYLLAKGYAERAIQADSNDAEGHYALALALGRLSRTMGGREKLKYAKIIREEDLKALALNPDHDGAHHVLGAWNAEVKRLSGATKFFAKALFGAGFLNAASWDSATANLERAVELNPGYIYHHLELAEVYVDLNRNADAIRQLEAIQPLSDSDVLDREHRRRAAELLKQLQAKAR